MPMDLKVALLKDAQGAESDIKVSVATTAPGATAAKTADMPTVIICWSGRSWSWSEKPKQTVGY